MKTNMKPAAEKRDHIENHWDYEDETRKIYTGQDMAEITRDAEKTTEAVTVTDFVRVFLSLNTDAAAALDVFAAAASFKYNVTPKRG